MEEKINQWFNDHFCNRGIDTVFYNLALEAKDDLIKLFSQDEQKPAVKK